MTKIVCRLQREGGSQIDMGGKTYHFKPDADGVHVCDVKDKKHADRLLEIPEAYHAYGKEPVAEMEDEPVEARFDPEAASNIELAAWAKALGINSKSKQSIADYAMDQFGEEMPTDDNTNCAAMIRKIANMELECED